MGLRFIYAKGSHAETMRQNMLESPLFREGDCILVWVNEGDFWGTGPIDMDAPKPPQTLWELIRRHGVELDTAQKIVNDALVNGVSVPNRHL